MDILLAECEIELIPPSILSGIERSNSSTPRSIWITHGLLDSNFHHKYMRKLNEKDRRGRPDILFLCLHTLLSSPKIKKKNIKIYFSTRDGTYYKISNKTRIPRSYNRFCGIISALLKGRKNPLIERTSKDDLFKNKRLILYDENGELPNDGYIPQENDLLIIGCFPRGKFKYRYPYTHRVKVHNESIDSWGVIGEILCKL